MPRNLREGWRYKRGTRPADIYVTLQSGLMGTPMPSVADTLSEEETWQLTHYVGSLVEQEDTSGEVVLHAAFAADGVPEEPGDARWAEARPLHVPLVGQVLVAPRWQNPSVQRVTLRAWYDETRIAIHAAWDDRTQDRGAASPSDPGRRDPEAAPGEVETYFSVARAVARGAEDLSDALALQFPVTLPDGPAKPHFFLGSPRVPVNQWLLSAHPDGAGSDAVEERNARGIDREPAVQEDASQQVEVRTSWRDGQWQAVFVRPLATGDVRNDVQFERGRMIPMAVNAWDAANGEWGLQRSISSWFYLELEQPVGAPVYLASAITAALIAGLQLLLIRRGRRVRN